jgi:hypothetical protein
VAISPKGAEADCHWQHTNSNRGACPFGK